MIRSVSVQIIGGGLAGCEAAWQLAKRGVPVDLYEMKPLRKTPAQQLDTLAELVDVRWETIIRIEKGKYNPSLTVAWDIAKALDASIEEIFSFEDEC